MDRPTPGPGGVSAAPNHCLVEARIVSRKQDPRWEDKIHLKLELLGTEDIEGPNFARALIGNEVLAYGFDLGAEFSPEASIQAEAEFHGDERGGEFQLSDLRLLDDP